MTEEKIVLNLWELYPLMEFCERMNIQLAIDAEVIIKPPIGIYSNKCKVSGGKDKEFTHLIGRTTKIIQRCSNC